mgnify:CR=1 FL=1
MTKYIRVSLGTANILGLTRIKVLENPTTAYLMSYIDGKCYANCKFCTQARDSSSKSNYLSRIIWPKYPLEKVLEALQRTKNIRRICLQTLIYPRYIEESAEIIGRIKSKVKIPISVSIHPRSREDILKIKNAGAERIGIGLDAATKELFEKVKSPFSWYKTIKLIDEALEIFGKNKVSVHLIYGLGESDLDFIRLMINLEKKKAIIGLFAFTPMEGTALENKPAPRIEKYWAIQLAHHLITKFSADLRNFKFDEKGNLIRIELDGKLREKIMSTFNLNGNLSEKEIMEKIIRSGEPFLTKGCPHCNRPFYNERPGELLYNYPSIKMVNKDIEIIFKSLNSILS